MNIMTWSFVDFVQWLRTKSVALRLSGATVDFDVHEAPRASARLRVERGKRLGELTVWEDGAAHMAIIDLSSGDFIFEQDGVSLVGVSPQSALGEFFDRLETAV